MKASKSLTLAVALAFSFATFAGCTPSAGGKTDNAGGKPIKPTKPSAHTTEGK